MAARATSSTIVVEAEPLPRAVRAVCPEHLVCTGGLVAESAMRFNLSPEKSSRPFGLLSEKYPQEVHL